MMSVRIAIILSMTIIFVGHVRADEEPPAPRYPVPLIWCDQNGQRWGETGSICHPDPTERQPVTCLDQDAAGNLYPTDRTCSVPDGFDK